MRNSWKALPFGVRFVLIAAMLISLACFLFPLLSMMA